MQTLSEITKNHRRQYGKAPSGFVVYRGPSQIDGQPIVAIAVMSSSNNKTDDMPQVFIIRADIPPLVALKTGADRSICGDCLARPVNQGWCYVNVAQSVNMIWKCLNKLPVIRGGTDTGKTYTPYPDIADKPDLVRELFSGRDVRLGAYGDPAALPITWLDNAMSDADGWNGYTHQWRTCSPEYAQYCMASIDRPCDTIAAELLGYRAFVARLPGEEMPETKRRAAVCPSDTAVHGKAKASCADCLGCGGTGGRGTTHRTITVHGTGYKIRRYQEWRDRDAAAA